MPSDADALIDERERTHGNWQDNSRVTDALWSALRNGPHWDTMPPRQRLALEMAAHKMSRIVCGDWQHADHWHDAVGYLKLGEPS